MKKPKRVVLGEGTLCGPSYVDAYGFGRFQKYMMKIDLILDGQPPHGELLGVKFRVPLNSDRRIRLVAEILEPKGKKGGGR